MWWGPFDDSRAKCIRTRGGTHEAFQKLVSQRDLLLSQAADVRSETIPPRDLADTRP